jgi:NADH pyrophosphatase NudC (nudix superfamily)
MNEIEQAIKHFENMRDNNFAVLDEFRKDIESGKVNGSTLVYDNRHLYYSLAIQALREKAERDKGCEYALDTPKDNGYDVDGRFYSCSCGTNYIEIEQAEEWQYCPYCGKEIISKETLLCKDCENAIFDGDGYYCECKDGKCYGDCVDDAEFCGCKEYCDRNAEVDK